jgi:hypothetical protein
VQNTNIYHIKGVNKVVLQSKNEINVISSYDKAINKYNNNQGISMSMEFIEIVI